MDKSNVVHKQTRSGGKCVEEELRETKRIKSIHLMVG